MQLLLIAALLGPGPSPEAHIAFCRAVLPLSDLARDSKRGTLYRRVMGRYEGQWRAWAAQAGPARTAEVEAANEQTDYRTASRQTKNLYAQQCVEASGVKADEQIVE